MKLDYVSAIPAHTKLYPPMHHIIHTQEELKKRKRTARLAVRGTVTIDFLDGPTFQFSEARKSNTEQFFVPDHNKLVM